MCLYILTSIKHLFKLINFLYFLVAVKKKKYRKISGPSDLYLDQNETRV